MELEEPIQVNTSVFMFASGPVQRSAVDSEQLEHGCRVIYAGFPSSLVWDWTTATLQISGFNCKAFKGPRISFATPSTSVSGPRPGGLGPDPTMSVNLISFVFYLGVSKNRVHSQESLQSGSLSFLGPYIYWNSSRQKWHPQAFQAQALRRLWGASTCCRCASVGTWQCYRVPVRRAGLGVCWHVSKSNSMCVYTYKYVCIYIYVYIRKKSFYVLCDAPLSQSI